MAAMEALLADITTLPVDAVVNAANTQLKGGGGVDGAIHRAAGEAELLAATRRYGHCETGDAVATPGFRLPARWIFHAVGPVWSVARADATGRGAETRQHLDGLLAGCYRRCMELAREHGVRSIAFPAISTGIYGFPADRAAAIAVRTVRDTLPGSGVERVTFCCFSESAQAIYGALLAASAEEDRNA